MDDAATLSRAPPSKSNTESLLTLAFALPHMGVSALAGFPTMKEVLRCFVMRRTCRRVMYQYHPAAMKARRRSEHVIDAMMSPVCAGNCGLLRSDQDGLRADH